MNVLVASGMFLLGACLGAAANLAIYRLAYWPRPWSPWNPLADCLARAWGGRPLPWPWLADSRDGRGSTSRRKKTNRHVHSRPPSFSWQLFVPVWGWLVLRAKAPWKKWPELFPPGFWIRGLLVELGTGALVLWWFHHAVKAWLGMSLPQGVPSEAELPGAWSAWGTWVWGVGLYFFLIVASGIDLDEWTIPDAVTVPGTLLALVLAALWPQAGLPVWGEQALEVLGPFWPQKVQQWLPPGQWGSLGVLGGCALLWCYALVPRRWYPRRGLRFALWFFFARMVTHRTTRRALVLLLALGMVSAGLWYRGGEAYAGWVRAMIGLGGGLMLAWSVRVVTSLALQKEALGFGDVTLMGMIGAYLGWQMTVVVFFTAPLAALALVLLVWVLARSLQQALPYGPALCLAAGVLVARWAGVWEAVGPLFAQAPLVLVALVTCLPLMALLLLLIRLLKWCLARETTS